MENFIGTRMNQIHNFEKFIKDRRFKRQAERDRFKAVKMDNLFPLPYGCKSILLDYLQNEDIKVLETVTKSFS
jgi:hypothetical protein